jgi:hypothetical protein
MAKLGWIVAAALAGLLVIGAKAPMDDSKQLEEIKALLTESNRVQRIDVHRRIHKHPLLKECDLAERCQMFDARVESHNVELSVNEWHHPFAENCGTKDGCKKAEESWREVIKARKAALEKK